jgi:glycine cleavage system H lipoate-binding protein/ABC-type phosphate transport system substrate-binding protein
MKRVIYLLIGLLLINYSNLSSKELITGNGSSSGDSIKILTTPDLYNLSVKWTSEYKKQYPETKIRIITVSENLTANNPFEKGDIGFFADKPYPGFENESIWKIVVGREIIVPVFNSKNPYLEEINKRGVSPDAFIRFFESKGSQNWGTLLSNSRNTPAICYSINDASVKRSLATFLKKDEIDIIGSDLESKQEMISAIQKDPYAIGFCKIADILDFETQAIAENLNILPIDRSGNGLIDYNEKIYDDLNIFFRGVWIGKYPKTLISNVYSVSSSQPEGASEIAFLKWVITDGQQFLGNNGYSDLLLTERQTTVDKLYEANFTAGASPTNMSLFKTMFFIITGIILAGLLVNAIARKRRRKKAGIKIAGFVPQHVLDENTLIVPAGLYFDKTHTWAFMEQNGIVKVGVDDFLQHITGNITRIKMKNPGDKVKKGEQILSIIQNGKQINLYAPISGIIREQNGKLETNSSIINNSPYTEGWIYKIEPANWLRENQLLFMAEKQKQFIKNELSRLKDFLAATLSTDMEKYGQIILQDGGEIRDGILSELGPEVWEEFQTKFIDPSRQLWFYEIF